MLKTGTRKRLTATTKLAAPPESSTALKPAPAAHAAEKPLTARPGGKLGKVLDLLEREDGATIAEMTAVTGWQAHSVRGALAGALKKKRGIPIVSEKTEQGRRYRTNQSGEA